MSDPLTIAVSFVSLAISASTAWLTLFRRGTVKLSRPAVVFFGPNEFGLPKVFLRTLLYATGKRGRVVEAMYARLTAGDHKQAFNVWVYGDKQLVRGSGLFVSESGVEANHHFLLPADVEGYRFVAGAYTVEVFAKLVGDRKAKRLWAESLPVSEEHSQMLIRRWGLYFDWDPESSRYVTHLDQKTAVSPPLPRSTT